MPVNWNEKSERDLMLAMLMSGSSSPGHFKAPHWASVVAIMTKMGYNTNESAISQRWSKNIFRDIKAEHPELFKLDGTKSPAKAAGAGTGAAQPPATPTKAGKKRRGRPSKKVENDDDDDILDDKPIKKPKLEKDDEYDEDEDDGLV
ncbi:hypothetical protein F4810DRAFT_710834 [Camillea tinctor]|nr:hypothetical protein F4810DRAFT_710834 [Camillea tinctor]